MPISAPTRPAQQITNAHSGVPRYHPQRPLITGNGGSLFTLSLPGRTVSLHTGSFVIRKKIPNGQGNVLTILNPQAYNKNSLPSAIAGYTGPNKLGGAINAPLDSNGHDTYMGYKFFPSNQSQGYTPQTCANACNLQTTYNSQHSATNGSYQSCVSVLQPAVRL